MAAMLPDWLIKGGEIMAKIREKPLFFPSGKGLSHEVGKIIYVTITE